MSATLSHVEETRSNLRDRVMGAVAELVAERPLREVTMAEVAAQAGVSRQTLYNSFGSRPELAQAFVIEQADGLSGIVEAAIKSGKGSPHEALEAGLELFFSAAQIHPMVRAITAREGNEELLALVTTRGGPLLERVTGRLGAAILETWPTVNAKDAALAAETLARLAISHAALPSGSPAETAREIVRLLRSSIDAMVGPEPG